ncbi:MAG: hypothetical protein E7309_06830 [Butyrivibrio sp.]|jgi:hypothetical protein|nr:hypothetical protein [Butyrivibrio sp.]
MRINNLSFYDREGDKLIDASIEVQYCFDSKRTMIIEAPSVLIRGVRLACRELGAFSFINEYSTIRNIEKIGRYFTVGPNAYVDL